MTIRYHGGPVYKASFSATAVSAASDLFHITAPSNSRVRIKEIVFGQYSDAGDAEAEILSVLVMAGTTSTGAGSAITAQNVERHSGAPTASSSALGPTATLASTTSADVLIADVANVAAGWVHRPDVDECIIIEPSERLVVQVSAPADSITMNGTLTFQEIGQIPS